jgi:uncharacterized protein
MKVVCTGGTGFVGAGLIPALLTEGHSVVLLSRRQRNNRSSRNPNLRRVSWNGRDDGPWTEELEGAGAVVNLAGEPLARKKWTPEQKARIVDSRVNATRVIVRAIQGTSRKPEVLINASGVGYYGDTRDLLVTENSPPGNGFLAETCTRWEAEAWEAEKLGVRTVVLRSGLALGEQGGALSRMVLAFKAFAGGPLGSGKQWFPWVHRDDLVSVILNALSDAGFSGPLNIAAPEAVTNRQFCEILGKVLRRPCWFPVPETLLRLVFGEMSSMILTGQHVVPARLQELGYKFHFPALEPALQEILLSPPRAGPP